MSIAVILSAAMALSAPGSDLDPLTGAELVETLSRGWWCGREREQGPGVTCRQIVRFEFTPNLQAVGCEVMPLASIEELRASGAEWGAPSIEREAALLDSIEERARAAGADRIRNCYPSAFKLEGGEICFDFEQPVKAPRVALTGSAQWTSEEDVFLSADEARRYHDLWPALFDDIAGAMTPEERAHPDAKPMLAMAHSGVQCHVFARMDNGALLQSTRAADGTSLGDLILRPLDRPEDGSLEPWTPQE